MKKWLALFVSVLIVYQVNGQESDSSSFTLEEFANSANEEILYETKSPSELPTTQKYSSENITVQKFDEKKWREIIGDTDYSDTRTKRSQSSKSSSGQNEGRRNPGSRATDKNEDDERYDSDETSSFTLNIGPLGQIIFYTVIAIIIAVILFQIIKNTSFNANPKRSIATNNAHTIEDIATLDTDDLIRKAQYAKDYKLAIRLYFLDLLKKLNEKGIITWKKDKTNRDYLSELFSKQFYFNEVRTLTAAYERVWYGEHVPTEENYDALTREFQSMNQKMKAS